MKPTAAPPWFPYPDHRTMAEVMAGHKSSEKLIERADSAIESGKAQNPFAQSVSGRRE